MNYLKIYCNLIRKADNRNLPEEYTEKHHIFPISIYGKNNKIVVLTGREHYIAHTLLAKICIKRYGLYHKNTQKMLCAIINMKSKGRYFNSLLYQNAKIKRSESMRGKNHWNWKGGNKYNYNNKEIYNTNENYKRYEYKLISPNGKIITTTSMRKTCKEYNLDHRHMNSIVKGKRNHHKGWKAEIINIL